MNSPSNTWSLQQLFGFLDQNKDGIIDLHDIIAVCNSPNAHVDQVT
jgi:solute carrier family 25 phosphate transporter 23/24/25/41